MIVLCGKSGSGKNAIRKALINEGLKPLVTYTTRPMRPGEEDGVDYHFVTDDEFFKMRRDSKFVEWTSYKVESGVWYYGTPVASHDNVVAILNPDGIKTIKRENNLIVYVSCPQELRIKRCRERGDSYERILNRTFRDMNDFAGAEEWCDISVKNDGSVSLEQIAMLIKNVGIIYEAVR